ncbi:pyocin knob domain-containing protein [Achromobacter sp. NFACC18-2]|uniref:pyocin knob domain-containing protein n=1 Tax=Achromobacter sp. NFACC18-2 TaxID=1564112 RepID=UPI0008D13087|nr:pyocin knob domain-containing protein [Achromobacter sp. NFACC18-2]SEJ85320.1 hypothetical protein SAMN03159494_03590 [Achromobacter sp. NFACC18-2]
MAELWYRTGTLTLTQGSREVSGAGSAFLANVRAGDMLIGPIMDMYEVTAVLSDTALRINKEYAAASYVGTDWSIAPTTANLKQLSQQISSLVALYQEIPADVEAAQAAANAAASSAESVRAAEANAKASETAAKSSQTAAATSATNANTYRGNALTYSTNAKTSETNAKTSETNAKASETAAKTSETNAAASAAAAVVSASALNNLTNTVAAVQTVANAAIPMVQKGANGGVADLDSLGRLPVERLPYATTLPTAAHNLNTYVAPGEWYQGTTASASVANGYPEGAALGMLAVKAYGTAVVQEYTNRASAGRKWWRTQVNSTTWSLWFEVASTATAMTRTALAVTTDANTMTADNTFYIWTASSVIGANFPTFSAGFTPAAGYMRVYYGNAAQVSQELTFLISGNKPRTFFRFGNSTTGVWQPWKSTSAWHSAVGLPNTNCGDIYVDGQGWYSWDGTAYALTGPNALAHGQCRFYYTSATECRLYPYGGNGLAINGKQYRLPSTYVSVSNASLAASTLYYAYARDNGSGGIAVDFLLASSNPHSTHTDGVEIRTGDPRYTLVGMAITSPSGQFSQTGSGRYVASWFNRRPVAIAESASNNTTASTSYVKLQNGVYTLLWAGDSAMLSATGIVRPGVNGGGGGYMVMTVNGTAISGGQGYTLSATSGTQQASVATTSYYANSDGYYNFAPYGFTSASANPATFYHDVSALTYV